MRLLSCAIVFLAAASSVCFAQVVTSAHSGTLHYFDGEVSIDGMTVQAQVARFSEIKEQSVLRTGQGRAEVLLTPGVFLRIGENSAIRMLDNRLISTRVEIMSGKAIVESDDPQMSIKNSPVTLIYKDYEIRLLKHGLVEISSDPAEMKVYNGEAQIVAGDNRVTVGEGHLVPFSAALTTEKFNGKVGDDLFLWARDRSQTISAANMSSARTIGTAGNCNGFVTNCGSNGGYGGWDGGWYYNPYFNMYTYIPGAGVFWNPFGYGFYSPVAMFSYYAPGTYWGGGGVGRQSTGLGGLRAGSTPASSAATGLGGVRAGQSLPGGSVGGSSPGGGSRGSAGSSLGGGSAGGASAGGGGSRGMGGARGR